MQKAKHLIFLTGLPLGHVFRRCPPPLSQPLSVSAPLSVLFYVRSQHSTIKKSPNPILAVLAGKKEKTCLHVIFSVIFSVNDFNSLSFPTKLDITAIPRPAKFLANRTDYPRRTCGIRYSHSLIGASLRDTHRPWGEACSIVGLYWHVFDSGKKKQKQIL